MKYENDLIRRNEAIRKEAECKTFGWGKQANLLKDENDLIRRNEQPRKGRKQNEAKCNTGFSPNHLFFFSTDFVLFD